MTNHRTQLLHFDSLYATYLSDPNSSTGVGSTPYRAQFSMNQAFRKISRVHLKSIEIPVGFSNVRAGSTATLSMLINGTAYSVVLAEKNYLTISPLIVDLNVAFASLASGVTITFSLTTSVITPLRLVITLIGATTFSIVDTNFSKYILGFRGATDSIVAGTTNNSTGVLVAANIYSALSCNYNLNPDNYVLMYIPSLNGMNGSMAGPLSSTFKVPLNSISNQVYYYFENSSFPQYVDIYDQNLVVANIIVYILDRFGNSINPNGLDYSFSLSVDFEI